MEVFEGRAWEWQDEGAASAPETTISPECVATGDDVQPRMTKTTFPLL